MPLETLSTVSKDLDPLRPLFGLHLKAEFSQRFQEERLLRVFFERLLEFWLDPGVS